MSYKLSNVTLTVGTVIQEKQTIFQSVEQKFVPQHLTKVTVGTVNGKEYKTQSPNQAFPEKTRATIMIHENGKADLMFDELTYQIPGLDLDVSIAPMFNGTPPAELHVKLYTEKFKLFGGSGKMKKEMLAGRAGKRQEALVIRREVQPHSQIMSKVTIPTKLLLLVRDNSEWFITSAIKKISFNMGKDTTEFANIGAATSVGAVVEVTFDPNNPAAAVISGHDTM